MQEIFNLLAEEHGFKQFIEKWIFDINGSFTDIACEKNAYEL